jgi:ribosome biogenesis GTPase
MFQLHDSLVLRTRITRVDVCRAELVLSLLIANWKKPLQVLAIWRLFMLENWGWRSFFESSFHAYRERGLIPARVTAVYPSELEVVTQTGTTLAVLSGNLRSSLDASSRPTVGDWVAIDVSPDHTTAVVEALLPRQTLLSRKSPSGEQQLLAANVDTVLIATSANAEFNQSRLERYMALTWDCGAKPVLVLTKIDQVEASAGEAFCEAMHAVGMGVPVVVVSAVTGVGLTELTALLPAGQTAVLLGSSGVGKSTLINALRQEESMATSHISSDGQRGRHTTTHRQLLPLQGGACLIDTPGMRELLPVLKGDGLEQAFEDVEILSRSCRFRDCTHQTEPGCAVIAAIQSGEISKRRVKNYAKLQAEQARLELKTRIERGSGSAKQDLRKRDKAFAKQIRQTLRFK